VRRIEILKKTMTLMTDRMEELALEAAREGGKPLIDSRVEAARAVDGIQILIETLRTQSGREIPMRVTASSLNRLAFTRFEPIGVVVAVSAFNHPLNLIVHQVGPAVAVGCPVIVKPASDTPLSCMRFVQILHEAGLPKEWCQGAVITDRELATKLVTDPRVAFFSFIGSAEIGWKLRSKLAPGTRCALEHGGVAPVIVAPDADLDQAVPLIAKGGFYHAGQVCVSVQRVFAHESIARKLADRLAEAGNKMKVGDPTLPDTEIGPMIRHPETDRVHQWVQEAVQGGGTRLSGGEKISDSLYPATVLFNPPPDAKVSRHEVFGPVICVYSFSDMDGAIDAANSLPDAFQSAVFTKDIDTALRAYARLDASAVMVNDHTAFRVDWMPFAGLRTSGHGVGGMPATMHDMQVEKMMVLRSKEL
jgi:acyl-CoA reductase-like NAD-dependent aldehyde dehydrogenase